MWLEITPNTHELGDMAVKAKALTGVAKKGWVFEKKEEKRYLVTSFGENILITFRFNYELQIRNWRFFDICVFKFL